MAAKESGTDTLDETLKTKSRIVELSSDDDDDSGEFDGVPFPGKHLLKKKIRPEDLPPWIQQDLTNFLHAPPETETSRAQNETTLSCLPYLTTEDTQNLPLDSHGLPHLRREKHAEFLRGFLGNLPAPFAAMDASRPWLFYWCIAGLSFLSEDVSEYKERLIETVASLQNPTGGFGGGHGQFSHIACTYATVLALAMVGGLDVVDRRAMWNWLGSVKQADGGFRVAVGAEEDIRGAYCAMTVITLLNLQLSLPPHAPARQAGLESFTDRLGEWIGRCQTYEGGMAGAPNNEAHGAYAFCGLACLSILDAPQRSIPTYLDLPALINWLSSMQTTPEGGFAGRSNKLVDACYSHWVGGCWSLISAALPGGNFRDGVEVEELWNREALVRYLLTCCQQPGKKGGGMRDKPSARPDAYHTNYSLSGLSAAMNHYIYDTTASSADGEGSGRLTAAFNWSAERCSKEVMKALKVNEEDLVECVHPVFVIPFSSVEGAREQFEDAALEL